jgi:hypothetical protein
MNIIILVLAIFGLAFTIKQTEGPWEIVSRWRNFMMRIPFIGVQFYKLLDCYFCLGFHCGWIVYLLSASVYHWQFFILWGLAGGTISLILDGVLTRLHRE